jgi:hypothetical protein
MDQTHYDNTVRQQKLLLRQACVRRFYRELDQVNWYSLWEELRQDMRWDELPESQQILISQANGQARDEIKRDGLFPPGWDVGTINESI